MDKTYDVQSTKTGRANAKVRVRTTSSGKRPAIKPRKKAARKTKGGFDRDRAVSLAQTIKGSRREFADAFRVAQESRSEPVEFEAVARGILDDTAAFVRAFIRAAELGWFNELCIACWNNQIVSGDFVAATAGSDDPQLAKLQQITDGHRGISDAGLLVDRLPRAVKQVCRIEIDGEPRGTGFLIRSDLVMTAYHVIRPLLQSDNTASPGSAVKLRVRFGFARREQPGGAVTLVDGVICRVAEDWLVKTSPCTADEILDRLPKDCETLQGFWDFAVIRLAEVPGVARSGLQVANVPVAKGHRLFILQHPKTWPVAWDRSIVRGFLGSGAYRIVHDVNTEDGSSGSPCLNDDFQVVGLHQARMPRDPKGKGLKNRAVPMPRILGTWALGDAPLINAPFGRILTVDTTTIREHPVFGRVKLQEWVARSAADAGSGSVRDRFLVVSGHKGAGKTFTIDVLKAMLSAGEHCLLECRGNDFNADTTALEFAAKHLVTPLGGDARTLPSLSQANTSDNAWLNYQFIGDLLNLLEQSRKKRMVWVVLDELDQVVLPDQGQIRKLLDLLYARAATTPWIRFILLGLEAVPIPGTGPITEREFPSPLSEAALAADVGDYLIRRLDSRGAQSPEEITRATAKANARQWLQTCNDRLDHPDLMTTAVSYVVSFEENLGLRRTT